jgi:hypothetical protein
MATATESEIQEPQVSTLIAGIIQDARKLMVQQLTLFQVEFKHDLQRTWMALIPLVLGVAVILTGVIVSGIGVAHLLCALFPDLPLWGGFLVVGGVVSLAGVGLCLWGKTLLADVKPMDNAVKALEENVTWKTNN